jgi:excisionase family DNA binding protein
MKNKNVKLNSLANFSNWFTRKQACEYLQIGISTLDKSIHLNKYYFGKSVRYHKNDLDDYLFAHCIRSNKGELKNGK